MKNFKLRILSDMLVPNLTKSDMGILLAMLKGYTIDKQGVFRNPKGAEVIGSLTDQGYLRHSIRHFGIKYAFFKHRFQMYKKYGNSIFDTDLVTRHLDGNKLNNTWENLVLGTELENCMDKPKEDRIKYARNAASVNRRFTDEVVTNIRKDRELGKTYRELCIIYNTSKSTLSFLFNKAMY